MSGPLYYDRVKETTTTTGTGTVTLAGAVTGYQSFAVVGNANTCYYCIAGQGTAEWEVGTGTYTSSGTTLARSVIASSNSNSLVSFSAGTKDVFLVTAATAFTATGTGNLVRATSPTLVTPALGTPASGNLANCTGPWGAVQLVQVVTSGSASTITFSSIPATFTNLKVVITGRCSSGTVIANWMKINSDGTSGNYDSNAYIQVTSGTVTGGSEATGANGITAGTLVGTTSDAQAVGVVEILIPSYAGTTFHKVFYAEAFSYGGAGAVFIMRTQGGRWKSTAAITQIDFTAGSGTYVNGTTATLYGML